MQDGNSARVLLALALSAVVCGPHAGAETADPFAECEAGFAAEPSDRQSVRCFFEVAKAGPRWDEAARRLEAHRGRHPDNPWLPFFLGHIQLYRGSKEAEERYRDATRISKSRGDVAAEVAAYIALARYHRRSPEDAAEALARAVDIAEEAGDPVLLAEVRIRQARQSWYEGRGLDEADHLLQRIEEDVFRAGSEKLRRPWLDARAVVSHALGRNDDYLRFTERLLEMAVEARDRPGEASARFDIAYHHITTELPSPESRSKARGLLEAALAAAEAADHPSIAGQSHRELGRLLSGEEGRRHLEACLEVAERLDDGRELRKHCLGALAAKWIREDPRRAEELMQRALAASAESSDPWFYGWQQRWPVFWATLPRRDAVRRSLGVLDGIEALRESQASGGGRAGLLSVWTGPYYWLSGRLMDRGAPREDLERAFDVTERMRSRVLLEALEAARASSAPPADDPAVQRLSEVLAEKVEIQRRMLDPALAGEARDELDSELAVVESEAADLEFRVAQTYPVYATLRRPDLATLSEVEESLGDNEALFSFQIGLDEDFYGQSAGGSWLLVSTRDGTRSYRLSEDRATLEPAVQLLLDLPRFEGAEKGLARLQRTLLEEALDDLSPGIERLAIVPDGELNRLPFALLRSAGEDGEPLIARFEPSVAPSATLWRRWKKQDPPASEAPVLALADPVLMVGEPTAAGPAAGGARPAGLEPLPYARQEGRAVVRTLGGESRLLVGEEATERFLKGHDLQRYGVLHFATHAVINREVPERSAVMLAPGAEDEDGWLQPQEIVELDLGGRVVVLASCDSAAGQVLRGEGVMSLARAFFQAGSPAVVASLWPLPDDWTAAIFDEFYRRLAAGASVAGALAGAQREMIRDGAPARAWAGLVALGDGGLVPFPGGLERPTSRWWIAGVVVAVLLLAALGITLWRRRTV